MREQRRRSLRENIANALCNRHAVRLVVDGVAAVGWTTERREWGAKAKRATHLVPRTRTIPVDCLFFAASRDSAIIFLVLRRPILILHIFILSHTSSPDLSDAATLRHTRPHAHSFRYIYTYICVYRVNGSVRKLAHSEAADITVLILRVRFTDIRARSRKHMVSRRQ